MPRSYLTWEGHPAYRWSVQHDGVRYRTNCNKLGLPRTLWTKEGSAQAANDWWNNKLVTIQAAAAALHPHAERLKELTTRQDYAKRHGLTDEAEIIDAEILRVQELPATPEEEYGPITAATKIIRVSATEHTALEATDVWEDRLEREGHIPHENTIGVNVDRDDGSRQVREAVPEDIGDKDQEQRRIP